MDWQRAGNMGLAISWETPMKNLKRLTQKTRTLDWALAAASLIASGAYLAADKPTMAAWFLAGSLISAAVAYWAPARRLAEYIETRHMRSAERR